MTIINQWTNWKLTDIGKSGYKLFHLCGNGWNCYRSFRADDGVDALLKAKDLIADADRKLAS